MRYEMLCSAVFAASLVASTAALAQISGPVGTPGVSPATPPTLIAPMPTGNSTAGVNQPGVPNVSTPGVIGTGATVSGLPGDSTHHPGFPGRIGGHR